MALLDAALRVLETALALSGIQSPVAAMIVAGIAIALAWIGVAKGLGWGIAASISGAIFGCLCMLLGLGVGLSLGGTPKWPEPYTPKSVVGEHFTNTEVLLDGHSYMECDFHNVTFVYNGTTAPQLNMNDISGEIHLRTDNPAVEGTLCVLEGLGFATDLPGNRCRKPNGLGH